MYKRLTVTLLLTISMLLSACGPWIMPGKMREEMRRNRRAMSGMLRTPSGVPGIAFSIANAEELGLTEEQVKELKPIYYELKKKLIVLEVDQKLLEVELSEMFDSDVHDLDALEKKFRAINDIRVKADILALKTHPELKRILTSKQLFKLKNMLEGRMDFMRDKISDEKEEQLRKQGL